MSEFILFFRMNRGGFETGIVYDLGAQLNLILMPVNVGFYQCSKACVCRHAVYKLDTDKYRLIRASPKIIKLLSGKQQKTFSSLAIQQFNDLTFNNLTMR